MPEKLKLTQEQARDIVWGDTDEFDIVKDTIIDQTRWSIVHQVIVRRKSDEKLFIDNYQVGATESQEESPYEYTEPDFEEAEAYEKTIVKYRVKSK